MKESEAIKKLCPELSTGDTVHTCVGSKCMMWEEWDYIDGTWIPVDEPYGDCGLKSKYLECNCNV